ncbi:Stk1 family PASTA domain-containing Ser/Thr kinase [Actinomycetota bacterium]|nr:Stk1 family PASTA domain-containing Ser/Thr kinase [Actinomycetota bacterium]
MDPSAPGGLIGQTLDQRYAVTSLLARGGMATVYLATDLRLDRVVALKVMHPHLASDPGFVARFQREARSAARLSHPHVVGVYDQGSSETYVYLAMEYLPGQTLRDVLDEYGPLSTEQALVLLDPVIEALTAAHGAGFVHRDIKPENVLISDDGRVKVADFGLARAVTSTESTHTTGMIIGTVNYLSPEQVERGDADARSDIYSTGILLFEMITGVVPHSGESPLSIAYKHVNSDVPPPSSVVNGIPSEVDALVLSATKRDPDLRYHTAQDFLSDVRRIRKSLPSPKPFVDQKNTLVVDRKDFEQHSKGAQTTGQASRNEDFSPAKNTRKGLWIFFALATGVLFAGLGGWWLAVGPGQNVDTPNLVGMTFEQAQEELLSTTDLERITIEKGDPVFSETMPLGVIVSTDPEPGSGINPTGVISANISQGPERYLVPDVAGMTPQEATATITAANLTLGGRSESFNDKIAPGQVAQTSPKIGDELKQGERVDLVISKGPKPIKVPNVVGQKIKAANASLSDLGLKVDRSKVFSETVKNNTVISIKPKAGNTVSSGSTVKLVVSKGPPPVEVPNLVDMPRKKAIAALEGIGLRAKVEVGAVAPLNRVISQSPAAGTQLPKGSTVTIRII